MSEMLFCKRCGRIIPKVLNRSERCPICGYRWQTAPFDTEAYFKMSQEDSDKWVHDNITQDEQTQFYVNKRLKFYEQNGAKSTSSVATNIPHCPICGSADLKKLSTVGKAAKIGMFGIFGMGDVGKTYKCNNCGSKF